MAVLRTRRPRTTTVPRAVALGISSLGALAAIPLATTPAAAVGVTGGSVPVRVVVDARTETVRVPVTADGVAGGMHGASSWITYPGAILPVLAGSTTGTSAGLSVPVQLDTTKILSWGAFPVSLLDDADGSTGTVVLDVRRRTEAMLNNVEARPRGRVALGARVTHYSPEAGKYISSKLSPVLFQERTASGWVTRARKISTADGLAGVVFRATPGRHTYRVVRPIGLTVWSDVSLNKSVVVAR